MTRMKRILADRDREGQYILYSDSPLYSSIFVARHVCSDMFGCGLYHSLYIQAYGLVALFTFKNCHWTQLQQSVTDMDRSYTTQLSIIIQWRYRLVHQHTWPRGNITYALCYYTHGRTYIKLPSLLIADSYNGTHCIISLYIPSDLKHRLKHLNPQIYNYGLSDVSACFHRKKLYLLGQCIHSTSIVSGWRVASGLSPCTSRVYIYIYIYTYIIIIGVCTRSEQRSVQRALELRWKCCPKRHRSHYCGCIELHNYLPTVIWRL